MTRVTESCPQGNRKLPPNEEQCDLSNVSRRKEITQEPWSEVNENLGRIWVCRDVFAEVLTLGRLINQSLQYIQFIILKKMTVSESK